MPAFALLAYIPPARIWRTGAYGFGPDHASAAARAICGRAAGPARAMAGPGEAAAWIAFCGAADRAAHACILAGRYAPPAQVAAAYQEAAAAYRRAARWAIGGYGYPAPAGGHFAAAALREAYAALLGAAREWRLHADAAARAHLGER